MNFFLVRYWVSGSTVIEGLTVALGTVDQVLSAKQV